MSGLAIGYDSCLVQNCMGVIVMTNEPKARQVLVPGEILFSSSSIR